MSDKKETTVTPDKMDLALDSIRTPLWGLLIISIFFILYLAQSIFIPVFLAILVALTLSPLVNVLTKFKISRSIGSFLILSLVSSILVFGINYLSAPTSLWFERLPTEIRLLEYKLSNYKKSLEGVQKTTESINKITQIKDDKTEAKQKVVVEDSDTLFTLIDGTQSIVAGALIFLVLLYFLLAYGTELTLKIGKYWFHQGYQTNVLRVSHEAQQTVGKYLLYISLINICLGTIVGFVMWFLGMPNPLLWGVSTAILNFIPYVGPAINLTLIALVSLLTFDKPIAILLPPLILLGLNIIEGQFIQPLIVGHMLTINPIIVFIFIIFWGWLWGVAGIFMAVPILVVAKTIISQNLEQDQINSPSSLSTSS